MENNNDSAFTIVKFTPYEYSQIEHALFASSHHFTPVNPRTIARFVLMGMPTVTEKVLLHHESGKTILLPTITEPELPSALENIQDSDLVDVYECVPDCITQPFHFSGDTAREIESIAVVARASISRVVKSAAYEAVMMQRKAFLALTYPSDMFRRT